MDKEDNHLQDTETRILQAAEKEFFEKGYAGARTASIAEAAGVTHAMLHYYFRTKDKLFEQIVSEKINKLGDIAANRELPRFLVNEVYVRPERIGAMVSGMQSVASALLDNLQHEIDECAAQGQCRQIDARMLLIDIVSLNVFPFMAAPIVEGAIGSFYESYDEFLAMRKKENVETVLRKLKIY